MPAAVGRIRKQSTFRALSRPDGRGRSGAVSVAFSRGSPEVIELPLFGFAVGRRYGSAVERNRLRRRLRNAARVSGPELAPGAYLVRATPAAAELGFDQLCRRLRTAALAAAAGAGGAAGAAAGGAAGAGAGAGGAQAR